MYSKKQRDSVVSDPKLMCAVEDCSRRKYAKGYCTKHYFHIKTTRSSEKSCSIPDCKFPHYGKGFCVQHYRVNIDQNRNPRNRFNQNKWKAENHGLEWTITLEEYLDLINSHCHYCEGEINKTGKGLDRKNNDKGYTLDNVLPCCSDCNYLRGTRVTVKELEKIIELLKTLRKKEKIWI